MNGLESDLYKSSQNRFVRINTGGVDDVMLLRLLMLLRRGMPATARLCVSSELELFARDPIPRRHSHSVGGIRLVQVED